LKERFDSRNKIQQQEIEELRLEVVELKHVISKKTEDILMLSQDSQSIKEEHNSLLAIHSKCEKKFNHMLKAMYEKLANLTAKNKELMRELQLCCEKVVELESVKNEIQEKYDNDLKASNKDQQRKWTNLESNFKQVKKKQAQARILPNFSICLCILYFFYLACRSKYVFQERNCNG
jgi:predicted phage-related endonuclease